ncbi:MULTISPECIES: hypothetical protein [Actinosynnema]|uniref:hypothetical protein n=1 Tax=Actinosynnema TaxID=40566 RepID=UPI0020A2FC58|nr:hypothetical protein [Actinosynnema pretiosum]MCP2095985.1 hypothetical protein [Actinosynnema pretiosum]
MSLLAEIAAVLRQVTDQTDSARDLLRTTADLLEEATADLTTTLLGSSNPDASQLLGTFAHCHRLAEALLDRLGAAEEHLESYLENLLGDGDGVPLWRLPVGRLHGEDAHGHTDREGVGIGRPARGSKKEPVREVRSTEELDVVFRALVRGGRRVHKPSYRGLLYRLPDGTTIGYRVKSSSTPEPTVDLNVPGEPSLKIHVNTKGWA